MKKTFIKLINFLYRKYGTPDVVRMTRIQLELFKNSIPFESLTDEQKERYCREANALLNNHFFLNVLNETVDGIKESMVLKTEAQNIVYDRFSINGLVLLRERITNYALQKNEGEEEFDKFESI